MISARTALHHSTAGRAAAPLMRTFTRSAVTRLLLPSAAFLVHDAAHPPQPASAAVKFSSGMEEVRKAASLIPGYGPPDIAYAAAFRGRWRVRSRVVDVKTPLGEDTAPADQLQAVRRLLAAEAPLEYEARFLEAEGNGGIVLANEKSDGIALAAKPYAGTVIADRAFNAERRAAAQPGAASLGEYEARWQPSNPNVLTMTCRGKVIETKVTKRSFDSPFDGALGTSEYARIADAGSMGVISSVPVIMASRVQTKYKWEPGEKVTTIEALELTQIFDPTATGFADLAGATPVLTFKQRLEFTR